LKGLEASIDGAGGAGGLYEPGGRGLIALAKPPAAQAQAKAQAKPKDNSKEKAKNTGTEKKKTDPRGWNELSVVALGDRVAVFVNGRQMAERTDPLFAKTGRIALALPGGQDADIRFKEIEILKLEGASAKSR